MNATILTSIIAAAAASIKMGVGIEFDTENSCRKYQLRKPVAPQQNRNRSDSVAVFSYWVQWCLTVREESEGVVGGRCCLWFWICLFWVVQ